MRWSGFCRVKNSKKWRILLVLGYLGAMGINLFDAIKYPDSELTIINLLASCAFLLLLVIAVRKSEQAKEGLFLKHLLLIAMGASILVFLFSKLESIGYQYFLIDLLANAQYPLYIAFIVPIFGFNYGFQVDYGSFSALGVMIYMVPQLGQFFRKGKLQ